MPMLTIPTSKDIFIEINGKKVAVIESFQATANKKTSFIEEFGNDKPVCAIHGQVAYSLTLKRVYFMTQEQTQIDFHTLSNFSVVIVKPDKRILYTGCEWSNIQESAKLNEPCIETMTVTASNRIEV